MPILPLTSLRKEATMDSPKHMPRLPFAFKPSLLGVGLPLAAFFVLTQNASPMPGLMGKEFDLAFVAALMAGFMLGCILTLTLRGFIRLTRGEDRRIRRELNRAQLLSTACILAVCLVLTILTGLGLLSLPALVITGVLTGFAFMPQMLCWARLYAWELPENGLFHAALSLMLTAVLYVLSTVPLVQGFPLVYAAVLVAVAAPATRLVLLAPSRVALDTTKQGEASPQERIPLRKIILFFWKPLLSGSICVLIVGLVWDPFVAEEVSSAELLPFLVNDFFSPLAAALLVTIGFLFSPRRFSLHIYNDVVMPIAIALLLVIPFISFEEVDLTLLTDFISHTCFALVTLAVWTALSAGVRTLGERSSMVFGLSFAIFALSMLTGMFAIHLIGTNGRMLCLVLLTVFLVLMVVDIALRERPQGSRRERLKEALEHFLQRRCDELAEQAALSAREREVFLYLARGYGQVYIARELYVSESTVRTHVRHIYLKLNINSREELLQLIDSG